MDDELDKHFMKSAKKGRKKLVAGNLLEHQREEDQKREKRQKKKTESSNEPQSALLRTTKDDDEWAELPEQKEIDLKNIRVANLGLKKTDEAADEENSSAFDQKTNDYSDSKNAGDLPWAARLAANTGGDNSEIEKSARSSSPVEVEKSATASGAYVSPAMRPGGSDVYQPPRGGFTRKGLDQRPDVTNVTDFPTLATASVMTVVDKAVSDSAEAAEGWKKQPSRQWASQTPNASNTSSIYQPPRPGSSKGTSTQPTGIPAQSNRITGQYVPPHLRSSEGSNAGRGSYEPPRYGGNYAPRMSDFNRGAPPAGSWRNKSDDFNSSQAVSGVIRHTTENVDTKTELELSNRFTGLTVEHTST